MFVKFDFLNSFFLINSSLFYIIIKLIFIKQFHIINIQNLNKKLD